MSLEQLEGATDEVISQLQAEGLREIPTSAIGPKVMARLQQIDPVAYVRYASVYRQFADVGEFLDEIRLLNDRPQAMDTAQPDFFR